MPQQHSENHPTGAGQHNEAQDHVRSSFHTLNVRIIRLAIALGVSLKDAHDLERVIKRVAPSPHPVDRRSTPDRRGECRSGKGPDRRVTHQWEELRGLLVLRYGVQKHCLEDFGIDATRRIVAAVDVDMQREGFEAGAAGIDLDVTPGPA